MFPFCPIPDATVKITVSSSSDRVAISLNATSRQVRVRNRGTADVWFRFGDSSVTADSTNDMSIGAGGVEIFTVPDEAGADYVAAIAVGSTGDIEFTPGRGI